MKRIYLSYPYKKNIPVYGSALQNVEIKKISSITNGDSSNSYEFSLRNHWGTHIDSPNHFFEHCMQISDYPSDTWFFNNPTVIEIQLSEGELLKPECIDDKISNKTDFLIIKTGWYKLRETEAYSARNPGIAPETAIYIRKYFKNVRALGIDTISISSYLNREAGRLAHKAFLNPKAEGEPILLVEDMNLAEIDDTLNKIYIFPLLIEGIDSSPVTIIGEKND
jgi:arylformamidase